MKKNRYKLLVYVFIFVFSTNIWAQDELKSGSVFDEMYCEQYFEQSVQYLLELEKGMEADVSFSLTVKDGIEFVDITEAVVSQLEKAIFDGWENEVKKADYPLIPTDVSGAAYMYWYWECEQRCLNCSIQWEEDELQVRLAIMQYEPLELEWDDFPFGLALGMNESQVQDVIDSLPYQYIRKYKDTAAECGCYTIFLPEHEELEYMQLRTDSMRSLQIVQSELDEPVVIPYQNMLTRAAYHWEQQDADEDRTDTMEMVSDTVAQTWNLDETALKDGYSWFRMIDKIMEGDPLLETGLWKNKFQHLYAYDQMLIGRNEFDGHVYFEYNGANAAAITLLKTWLE